MNQIFKQCNMKLHVYSSKGRLFKKLNLKKKSAATLTVAAAMSIISSKKGIWTQLATCSKDFAFPAFLDILTLLPA